jgi:hypothetical protein
VSSLNRTRRAKAFDEFDFGKLTILVTTDIGSRGLDMKESVSGREEGRGRREKGEGEGREEEGERRVEE